MEAGLGVEVAGGGQITALASDYDRLVVEVLGRTESVAVIRAVRRDFEWMST
ncbi:hypothetical protein ACWC9T_13535 [Kitasatospora sp. NPDC001159]